MTAVAAIAFAALCGLLLGVSAGYFGGLTDTVISRLIDIMLALPAFIMAIILMGVLGRGFANMIIAIGVGMSPRVARVVRGATLQIKENEFVEAAKSFGYSGWRIILRHIVPHCMTPVVVYATLLLGSAVMLEAGLSFLGRNRPTNTKLGVDGYRGGRCDAQPALDRFCRRSLHCPSGFGI